MESKFFIESGHSGSPHSKKEAVLDAANGARTINICIDCNAITHTEFIRYGFLSAKK